MLDLPFTRFRLDCDDDGHWYVVPLSKVMEFTEYVESEGRNDLPDGVVELGIHPRFVSFENWSLIND